MPCQPREDEDVLQKELDWSCGRPGSRANGESLDVSDPRAFIESFTANEYDFYLQYKALAPKGLFSLNQNPRVKGMKSKVNQDTHTHTHTHTHAHVMGTCWD